MTHMAGIQVAQAGRSTVNAGGAPQVSDGTIVTGAECTLSVPYNAPASYHWRLQGPTGSDAALSSLSSGAPTFTPDIPGEYIVTEQIGGSRIDLVIKADTLSPIDRTTWEDDHTTVGADHTTVEADHALLVAGSLIYKAQAVFTLAQVQALGAGVKTLTHNVGVLPANARMLGSRMEGWIAYTDGAVGTYALDVGGTVTDDMVSAEDVGTTGSGFPKGMGLPAFSTSWATQTITAKLSSSVDLNTTTAGTITVSVFYVVL